MDRLRRQLLAGATLAEHEHMRGCTRSEGDLIAKLPGQWCLAYNAGVVGLAERVHRTAGHVLQRRDHLGSTHTEEEELALTSERSSLARSRNRRSGCR